MTTAFAPVDQLIALREQHAAALRPLARPEPPEPPAASPSVPSPTMVGGGALVDWRGRRFDASVVPNLEALTNAFPKLRLTSGWRDPEHNRRVNGAPRSWHLRGRAADWVGSATDMYAAAAWAKARGAREALVHNKGSGMHLHVAW